MTMARPTPNPADSSGSRLACQVGKLRLVNPVICGSGEHAISEAGIRAALESGVSVVVAKSVNRREAAVTQLSHAEYAFIDENMTPRSVGREDLKASLTDSIFCRSGLKYGDQDWFAMLADLDRLASKTERYVAASIVLSDLDEARNLASMADLAGIRILELNIGAPHSVAIQTDAITTATEADTVLHLVREIRQVFNGALWIKLTGMQVDVSPMVVAAEQAGADAVCVTGRLMGFVPDLATLKPTLGTVGAYGGRWALPLTCRHLSVAYLKVSPDFSLLGTNGARTGLDVARMILSGARAVELTSLVYLQGFEAFREVIVELNNWLEQRSLTAMDLIGKAVQQLEQYSERKEHFNQWQQFVPAETLQ